MSQVTDKIRKHHRELLRTFEELASAAPGDKTGESGRKLLSFLRGDLLPHAHGEERHLYPLVDTLIKAHASATATMCVDHKFLEEQVGRVEASLREVSTGPAHRLERLLTELAAVLKLHLDKEEGVYLGVLEQYASEQLQEDALRRMHGVYEEEKRAVTTTTGQKTAEISLDVRDLPPPKRHPLILGTFNKLAPGEAFILVNDHDPKPLYYQFQAELTGQFSWDYLEAGPEVWRVRIGRTRSA